MNEQLQQALAAILNKTMEGVDAGVNFLSAEVPEVIHQLLMWKMVSAATVVGLCLLAAVVFTLASFKGLRDIAAYNKACAAYRLSTGEAEARALEDMQTIGPRNALAIIWFILCGVSWIFLMSAGLVNGAVILKIWIAPKIYLIEYAASLAK